MHKHTYLSHRRPSGRPTEQLLSLKPGTKGRISARIGSQGGKTPRARPVGSPRRGVGGSAPAVPCAWGLGASKSRRKALELPVRVKVQPYYLLCTLSAPLPAPLRPPLSEQTRVLSAEGTHILCLASLSLCGFESARRRSLLCLPRISRGALPQYSSTLVAFNRQRRRGEGRLLRLRCFFTG